MTSKAEDVDTQVASLGGRVAALEKSTKGSDFANRLSKTSEALEVLQKAQKRLPALLAVVILATGAVMAIVGLATHHFMLPTSMAGPPLLADQQVKGLTPQQLQAAKEVVNSTLSDEVISYRAMTSYLKLAIPAAALALLALFWAVVKSHVEARTATAQIDIREKTSEDMRKVFDDRFEPYAKIVDELRSKTDEVIKAIEFRSVQDSLFRSIQVDTNLSFALWRAGVYTQAAQYAQRVLERIGEVDEKSEHYEKLRKAEPLYKADAAYYLAASYEQNGKAKFGVEAQDALRGLLALVTEGNSSAFLVDAIIFVAVRIQKIENEPTLRRCANLYQENRLRIADHLSDLDPDEKSKLIAEYESFSDRFQGKLNGPVSVVTQTEPT